jgi:thioredoxin-related protein
MKLHLLAIICLPLHLFGNTDTGGVQFTQNKTWPEIKAQAKLENKYIFLDCYTTWCGPCKEMEKNVFSNDTVASYFNNHFISVRVQMDRTKKDDSYVQQWYDTADVLAKRYKIAAYPSFVFLSPEGQIVHKETGFKPVQEFIKVAETALAPGKVYVDPFTRYDSLVAEYKKGRKDYSQMLYMIEQATNANDVDMRKQLRSDYKKYLENSNRKTWYKKENIEFISSFVKRDSKFFDLFFPDGRRVDRAMNHPGYAAKVVDEIIFKEILKPFGLEGREDGYMWNTNTKIDSSEANWEKTYETIERRFNKYFAEKNLLIAKIYWYVQHNNFPAAAKLYFQKLEKYGIDTAGKFLGTNELKESSLINSYAWPIFLLSDNRELLNESIKWLQKVVKDDNVGGYLDTYANLLYKVGKKEKAIEWQHKALELAIKFGKRPKLINELREHLDKMKRGEPTWEKTD